MRSIARLALFAAIPFFASCSDNERNPFDADADETPPELGDFEIVTENQAVFAMWSASEPVQVVVEYADAGGMLRHSYPGSSRDLAAAGVVKLVGVDGNTQYTLSGVRLLDRAGNETVATPADMMTFTTGTVAAQDCFYFAMIDVGWGDALYLEAPDGTNVLIDAGHAREPDARPPLVGTSNVREHPVRWFLEKRGVTHLDFASMTHVHADHIGGFYGDDFEDCADGLFINHGDPGSDPCPQQPFSVGTFLDILDKTPGTLNGPYADLLTALDSLAAHGMLGAHVLLPAGVSSGGEPSLMWGDGVRVDLVAAGRKDFLLPDHILSAENGSVKNNDSMVYRVQYGDFVMLLMGDGEFATEQYLENNYTSDFLHSTVLKLGHHGSNDSNSERFLRYVDPVIALVPNAVSENPGVEHPFVLNRLRNLGVDYFASDRVFPNRERGLPGVRGDVHILTDGSAFTVLVDNVLYE